MLPANFNQLYYFWTVARTGSISEAARRLLLNQSTVSLQMKQLESALGTRLMTRGRPGTALTERGRLAFEYCDRIFGHSEEMLSLLRGGAAAFSPQFRLGVSQSVPRSRVLELADRLWPGAEGWFEKGEFHIACGGALRELLAAAKAVTIAGMGGETDADDEQEDDDDNENATVTPVELLSPVKLRLDWWADKSIKTWAGSMNVHCIALAMAKAIDSERTDPFSQCEVVYDPPKADTTKRKRGIGKLKKREPFYFDSLRGPNAHARDVGFSPNDLKLTTTASPAVEFLCLVGLQRSRPKLTARPRVFDYFTWNIPLPISVAPAAVNGFLPFTGSNGYQFKNVFRSGQKKLKAYMPAIHLPPQGA